MTKAQNEITLQNNLTIFKMKSDNIKNKSQFKMNLYYNSRLIIIKVCKEIHTHGTTYVCLKN